MIRVLVADDQALVRGAFAALLGLESDMQVVAEVGTGAEVVPAARRTRPDVALLDVQMLDVQMPDVDGLAATAALGRAVPGCRVLVCTNRRAHPGRGDPLGRAERLALTPVRGTPIVHVPFVPTCR